MTILDPTRTRAREQAVERATEFSDLGAAPLGARLIGMARAAAALHMAQALRVTGADAAPGAHAMPFERDHFGA